MKKLLSEGQIEYIKTNLMIKKMPEIAKDLGVDYHLVYRTARSMGLQRKETQFTELQDSFLRQWCGLMTYKELAERLNMKRDAVVNRCRRLGLRKMS